MPPARSATLPTTTAPSGPLPLPPIPPAVARLPLPPEPPPLPIPPNPHQISLTQSSKHVGEASVLAIPGKDDKSNDPALATGTSALAPRSNASADARPPAPAVPTADILGLAARRAPPPPGDLAAALLPFDPAVGAAAFRRGDAGYVVFDERRPIDMSAFATDPVLRTARVLLLPQGTLLRVPLPTDLRLALTRESAGWMVAVTRAPGPAHAILARVADGSLLLPLPTAARHVAMPDPVSGGELLVGTAHEAGSGTPFARRLPGFVLLRTWLGVAIEARSDRLTLSPTIGGFRLNAGAVGGLPLAPAPHGLAALTNAAALTRRFDFPHVSVKTLVQRLDRDRAEVIAAPARARFAPRLAEAQTLIALGMGPEAQTLLELSLADNPRRANDPTIKGLAAIAALLADRPEESSGLADPALSGSDEIALWRATRADLLHADPAGTAPVFAATAPLILAYPAALVRFLAPCAAQAMIAGGELDAASAFLQHAPTSPRLDLERAALLAARGEREEALSDYEKLAQSPDRPVSARAAGRAILLELTLGRIDARTAARRLARQLYAWRGPAHELRLRLKIAELRADSDQWRSALSLLRRTKSLFPKQARMIDAARVATFRRLFAKDAAAHLSPLELVSLIEENADLIPEGAGGPKLAELLSDRLLALDLSGQAAPVLAKLMHDAPAGAARAILGAKLASVHLARDEPAAALAALDASRATELPRPLAVRRALLYARAAAANGQLGEAEATLAGLDDPAAIKLRATFLEKTKLWKEAEAELARLVVRVVPPRGPLSTEAEQALVQLASVATQANDASELLYLHATFGRRMRTGSLADTFHLLTDPPATSLADLPEITRDATIAERLPEEIKAIGGTAQVVP